MSSKIAYRVGDLFQHIQKIPNDIHITIPHICNDIGGWGSGFVVPLGKHFPKAKQLYHNQKPPLQLGTTQYISPRANLVIYNMIAQHGCISATNPKPIRYFALAQCLQTVNNSLDYYKSSNSESQIEIHAPAFGSDLAGGNWTVISSLIDEILISPDKIYIYTLTQAQQNKLLRSSI